MSTKTQYRVINVGSRETTEQIQRIEAALGKARVSDANPCGAVVTAETNGTWTIADDWMSENYATFYGALEAAKLWAKYTWGSILED